MRVMFELYYVYLEFDDNFIGSCCFTLDWLIFGALVALCKWAGGDFWTEIC